MNVHPGERWDDQVRATRDDAPRVRECLGGDAPFGLGLRISAAAAAELTANPARIAEYVELLADQSMYVFTVNAFPFGTFHGARVKEAVYEPDWSKPERVEYTLQVARILASLLPAGVDGSISTAPLTFKGWPDWQPRCDGALRHVAEVARALWLLEAECGRRIVLAMEPEPGCYPETTPELIDTMMRLRSDGERHLHERYGVPVGVAGDVLRTYVGCCFDTAHQSVEFESFEESVRDLQKAGVVIAKVQVSAAIEVDCTDPVAVRELASMQDAVYLHQVGFRRPDGSLRRWYDLPSFLAELPELEPGNARVHYHVPLFVRSFGALRSTAHLVQEAAGTLLGASCHIEAETYTWTVWKQATGEQLPIHVGIARELQWLHALQPRGTRRARPLGPVFCTPTVGGAEGESPSTPRGGAT